MNTGRTILKNVASLILFGFAAQLLEFAAIVYLAKIFGPGDFGKISYASAVLSFFSLTATFGLPLVGTRELAVDRDNVNRCCGNVVFPRILLSVISFGLLLLFTYAAGFPAQLHRLIILYGLSLFPSALILDWVWRGIQKMEFVGIGYILSASVYLALIVGLVGRTKSLDAAPWSRILGISFLVMFYACLFLKEFGRPRLQLDLSALKTSFGKALPIGISALMVQSIYYMDTIILGFFESDAMVGYYNAAYRIIMLLNMVIGAYFSSIFPVLSSYYHSSIDKLETLQVYTSRIMLAFGFLTGCGLMVLAKPIIDTFYGQDYRGAAVALQILIWSITLVAVNSIYAWGLWACDRQNQYLKIVAVQFTANLGLNFLLIPSYGLIGASISTVAAELVGLPLYYREFSKICRIPLLSNAYKPLLASVAMGVFIYVGRDRLSLWTLAFLGGCLFVLVLVLENGISKEELKVFREMLLGQNKEN